MNTRTVLTISAVVALIYALAGLLVPTVVGTLYGFGNSPEEILIGRFFAVALLSIGVINWFAKDANYASLRPILLGNLVGDAAGLFVSLMGTLGGVMSPLGWLSVAIYLLFTLGFGYLYFMGQQVNVHQRA